MFVIVNDILSGYKVDAQNYLIYERKVERDIRRLKHNMASIKEGIRRREQKLEKMKASFIPRSIFGSKSLYKKKDTVYTDEESRKVWKEMFDFARHSSITLSGRCDSSVGNFILRWEKSTKNLFWTLPDKTVVCFPDFLPATYQKEFCALFDNRGKKGKPVSYTIDLRKDTDGREYFLVWATFQVEGDGRTNDYTGDGVISVDINADHLAWSELDGQGRRINGGVIPMNLSGLSSEQAADVIGRTVRILTTICELSYKPLVCEKLDGKNMRRKQKYGNKKKNRIVSQFAFERIIQTIKSQALRAGFEVIEVNPAYTSFSGKVVFMRKMGISIHEAASYVIGLIGMGIYPEVPEVYRSLLPKAKKKAVCKEKPENADKNKKPKKEMTPGEHFRKNWSSVYKKLKGVRTHAFYLKDIKPQKNAKAFKGWFNEHDVIQPEKSFVHMSVNNTGPPG